MMGFKFSSGYGAKAEPGTVGEKLEKLRAQLGELAKRGKPKDLEKVGGNGGMETITDDRGFPADRTETIRRDEALVRDSLALLGVDYDGLIGMENKDGKPSVYAQAVQANPSVLAEVAQAEQPVVAALKVALGFKPVAEFTTKYGNTPEEVKAAVRAEVEAELKGEAPAVKKQAGPVFSGRGGGRKPAAPKKGQGLGDLFGK